jgi:hypothetical protein
MTLDGKTQCICGSCFIREVNFAGKQPRQNVVLTTTAPSGKAG